MRARRRMGMGAGVCEMRALEWNVSSIMIDEVYLRTAEVISTVAVTMSNRLREAPTVFRKARRSAQFQEGWIVAAERIGELSYWHVES